MKRPIEDCTKWINKSASTIQEAKFCADSLYAQEYSDDIKEHLSIAIQALVYAQEFVDKQIHFNEAEFQYDNKDKPS